MMANLTAAITEMRIPQAKDGSCTTKDILEKVILPLASPDCKTRNNATLALKITASGCTMKLTHLPLPPTVAL